MGTFDIHVVTRRHRNDNRTVAVSLDSAGGICWDCGSGGLKSKALRPVLNSFVRCDDVIEGESAHSGLCRSGPHRIRICAAKKDIGKAEYLEPAGTARSNPRKPAAAERD